MYKAKDSRYTASMNVTNAKTLEQRQQAFWEGVEACKQAKGRSALSLNPYHNGELRRCWNIGWNSVVGVFAWA